MSDQIMNDILARLEALEKKVALVYQKFEANGDAIAESESDSDDKQCLPGFNTCDVD